MATKEEHKFTKKHFQSEKRKKQINEEFEKKEKEARHDNSPKKNREVKKTIKKGDQEEKRQSRRLSRHFGVK